jgi:ADP-ribose pyrophosphatase
VKRELLCEGERFRLYRDQIPWPGKKRVVREWASRPCISAVVTVAPSGLVLVRQHRWGCNRTLWEIPAGTVKDGESPRACALREVEEETGFHPGSVRSLGSFIPTPAFSNERVHLYLAGRLKPTRMNPDHDERITVRVFPEAEVRRMLRRAVIQDAKSIIALYRYFGKV